jgi:hypothetical protein
MNYDVVVARHISQINPEIYSQAKESVTPMLTDMKHIPAMFDKVVEFFPDQDKTGTMLLFVSLVYDSYCPAALLPKSAMKLPVGLRDEAARVSGYPNPEMINYFFSIAKAYMKGKAFRSRVDQVKNEFKQFSVNPKHWELSF